MSETGLRIRPADLDELDTLAEIERAAGQRFVDAGMFAPASLSVLDHDLLAEACWQGLLAVAVLHDEVVGFALCQARGADLHLRELDVHPDAQRRGVGVGLLHHVFALAAARGASRVTLTTFVDVPWNGPWYRRFGFTALEPRVAPPWLAHERQYERRCGLEVRPRQILAMRVEDYVATHGQETEADDPNRPHSTASRPA